MKGRARISLLLSLLFCGIFILATTRTFSAATGQQNEGISPLRGQTEEQAAAKSTGCISCHGQTDEPTMHPTKTVHIGCTDCHGGNSSVSVATGADPASGEYKSAKEKAHIQPHDAIFKNRSAVPEIIYAKWLKEPAEYVKFVNPGDLRVAPETCGAAGCHATETRAVSNSMMTHTGMLWGAALYNNGGYPAKDTRFGESYDRDGKPRSLKTIPAPTPEETRTRGVLPQLEPLLRWETSQPGNVLRVFERGGEKKGEIGNPKKNEAPGKPDDKLSDRGFGTELRTDPVFLGLQKTRLVDPVMSLPGTNDHPGDYRASGCSACHVIYANDRDPAHSADYAQFGNLGRSASIDPTIPKTESAHPIKHVFTRSIPSSQCMVCHIHPGTNMLTTYFGLTWWDNEIDGDKMYPKEQHNPSEEERYEVSLRNPEAAAARGLWRDQKFLAEAGSPEFNKQLKTTQFADFHGHGWVFRGVYKHDRKGNWLDKEDRIIPFDDPERFGKAVHLADIHLEKGMQCTDCHFNQDNHGNGKIYGEPRAAVEIDCVDCHGTINQKATLTTSGPAAPDPALPTWPRGHRLDALRTPWGLRRFENLNGKIIQRSMTDPAKEWEIVQTADTITPGSVHFNPKSLRAKLMGKNGSVLPNVPQDETHLAHGNASMTCYSCHTSWTPTCFGCHLQMTANARRPMLHNEGLVTRNYTSYNFQVLRDDIYMLGVDGTVTGHRFAPARSSCAILVSSQNANREWLYYTQQTISSPGFSGQSFSTFVPHTVRAKETKQCSDCHVSRQNDNNAWMAQVLLQGTNFMNFMGRYVYVATGKKGFEAIAVAEHDEPEAIYGSDLHRIAYPDDYRKFLKHERELDTAYEHDGNILDIQARGEYAYAAMGKNGLRVFDIANVDNKGFSERLTSAPVSPLGQRFYVPTKNAQSVASPTTLGVDPLRKQLPENEEQPIHLIYGFLYVADAEEGLVVIGDPNLKAKMPGVGTLLDGNPNNNFLKRALAFNPNGALTGARKITIAGTYAYIVTDKNLVVVDLDNPLAPKITATIGAPFLNDPRAVAVQFRYAFVVDRDGLKTLDVTELAQPRPVESSKLSLDDARNIYVARTYAYVSAGKHGIAIVDVENPELPKLDQIYNAEGKLSDVNDVKIGMVAASAFAFVADGKNGLRVLQILSPWDDPAHFSGFSPRPTPKLIATAHTRGPALAISKGIDRDRAVDESGNQLAVFGRRGARPLNRSEIRALYLHTGTNEPYSVTDSGPDLASRNSVATWLHRLFRWHPSGK
ncbi:MAG: hypothetical protein JSS69_04135 [Acidobacteria bacterium]|nr:hypothetical protein [Acidobacteriota bacterium]MBS1865085.1 hypothetical protein [Acidobacteriota bacterium]